jgi:hypothetical protein
MALNLSTCYEKIGGSAACAASTQEQFECEVASCGSSCPATGDISTCISSADTSVCATYVSGVTTNCGTTITGNASCGGGATTFEAMFDAVAATVCE